MSAFFFSCAFIRIHLYYIFFLTETVELLERRMAGMDKPTSTEERGMETERLIQNLAVLRPIYTICFSMAVKTHRVNRENIWHIWSQTEDRALRTFPILSVKTEQINQSWKRSIRLYYKYTDKNKIWREILISSDVKWHTV